MIRRYCYNIKCDIPNSFGIDLFFGQFTYEVGIDMETGQCHPIWIFHL